MEPTPDSRWSLLAGGLSPDGSLLPFTFATLRGLTSDWEEIVEFDPDNGAAALLRTARSLFAHAWFDYEFMAVACLVGFQATEAAFRQLYPEPPGRPLRRLVDQARSDGILPAAIADLAESGVALRNLLSHPLAQSGFTVGMAAGMLENQHRLVALLISAAASEA